MKITLFTSNKNRHNYLINLLSEVAEELYVIQECGTIFPGIVPGYYQATPIMRRYFKNVNDAQTQIFGNSYVNNKKKNIKILPISLGDLNQCSMNFLSDFLRSDIYIVFGSSFIKGELIDFLVKQKTINIHAGVSPYYRGTDCNFWALYDENPIFVGTTIHLLSKGLDSGPILYHAMSNLKKNPFEYSMSTIKSAFQSVILRIRDGSIFEIKPLPQDKTKELRYSKNSDFNEEVVRKYLEKEIDLNVINYNTSYLKDPFFLSS